MHQDIVDELSVHVHTVAESCPHSQGWLFAQRIARAELRKGKAMKGRSPHQRVLRLELKGPA